ncbi:hypothetical protein C8K36_10481 [Rhodococcus sp. OK519]|nr:hypothetical protein C8K36_10481 [Rhodococcus sp. OK519]
MLAEQHGEWIEGRRYLGLDVPVTARGDKPTDTNDTAEPAEELTPALTA